MAGGLEWLTRDTSALGAVERIHLSRAGYAEIFANTVGWSWEQAVASAARYAKPVRDLAPDVMQEIEGIAEGSGLPVGDVLAINARTEIIFAASAREAAAQRATRASECTALALLSRRTRAGRPLLAQNWDWLVHAFETVVVLEVEQPADRPNFVVMDLAERQIWLASGNPCTHPFEPLSFGGLLDKPGSLSGARSKL